MIADADPDVEVEPTTEELEAQLERSRTLVAEANMKADRGLETASEVSSILRRLAKAIDRNPRNWDDLFNARPR